MFAESGEFLGVIDLFSSLRWRRRYWEPGEVELHLTATEENIAMLQPGVILRRVDRKESARVMGIKTKGGKITANARMLEIYFSMAYVIGTKSFTGTPAEILCQLAEDARDSVPELVVDRADLPTGDAITIQLDFKNTLKAMTAVAKAYGLGFRLLYSTEQNSRFRCTMAQTTAPSRRTTRSSISQMNFRISSTPNTALMNPTIVMLRMRAAATAPLFPLTVPKAAASGCAMLTPPA